MICKNQKPPNKRLAEAGVPSCALRAEEEKNRVICTHAEEFKSALDYEGYDCPYANGPVGPQCCPLFTAKD